MNAKSNAGVLTVMDACETVLNRAGPWPVDKLDPRAYLVIREARATVERLAEDAEAMLADLEADMAASPASAFRMVASGNRIAHLRAALAAFRGDL